VAAFPDDNPNLPSPEGRFFCSSRNGRVDRPVHFVTFLQSPLFSPAGDQFHSRAPIECVSIGETAPSVRLNATELAERSAETLSRTAPAASTQPLRHRTAALENLALSIEMDIPGQTRVSDRRYPEQAQALKKIAARNCLPGPLPGAVPSAALDRARTQAFATPEVPSGSRSAPRQTVRVSEHQ
jgi:hypothetical protein